MPIAFSDADQGTASSASTVSTDNNVSPSGSNLYGVASFCTGTLGTISHLDADLGGTSFAEVGSAYQVGFGFNLRTSLWEATGLATGSQAASAEASESTTVLALGMAVWSGVDQSTPRGSEFTATGDYLPGTNDYSISLSSGVASGDKIVVVAYAKDEQGVGPTFSGGDAVRAQIASPEAVTTGILEYTADSANPTLNVTFTRVGGEGGPYQLRAFKLNAAAGGARPMYYYAQQ